MNLKKMKNILLFTALFLCAFIAHASAAVYLEDFTYENRKFYISNDAGYTLGVTDGKFRFDYSDAAVEAQTTAGAYLYHKYLQAQERMFLEFDFETSDTTTTAIEYEIVSYDPTYKGGFCAVSLSGGTLKFADGSTVSYTEPHGTFTIDAQTDENAVTTVKTYLNGTLVNTYVRKNFTLNTSYSNSGIQFRIIAGATLQPGVTGPVVNIDNVKTVVDEEPPAGIYVGEPTLLFDFGDKVDGAPFYTMSEYLYPYHGVKSVRQIANFTGAAQSFVNVLAQHGDEHDYQLAKEMLAPYEVVIAEVSDDAVPLNKIGQVDTYVWHTIDNLSPISTKNTAFYNGAEVGTAQQLSAQLQELGDAHPRLFFKGDELKNRVEAAREVEDATFEMMSFNMFEQAQDVLAMMSTQPPVYGSDNWNMVSRAYQRTTILGYMYATGQGDEYAAAVMKEMQDLAALQDWYHEESFLLTAQIALSMAHGYDLIYDYLCKEENLDTKAAIEKAIHDKAIVPALEVYRADEKNTWARRVSNWNLIPNGGIGAACLAIGNLPEYSEDCGKALNYAIRGYRYALEGFDPEGAWYEGPHYYIYMMNFAADFLAALQNTFDTDYQYLSYEGFANSAEIPLKLSGSREVWSFADANYQATNRMHTLMFFARYADRPALGRARLDQIAADGGCTVRDIIWYAPAFKTAMGLDGNYGVEEDTYFPDMQMVALHSDYGDTQAFVGAEAGPNSGGHSHVDMGNFVYDAQGEAWFVDLGMDNYNLDGYFDSTYNDNYYRLRPEGHNCVVLNPDETLGQSESATGSVTDYKFTDAQSYAVMDLSSAYAEEATSFHRMVYLDKQTQGFAISDKMVLKGETDYYWFAHTAADIAVSNDGKSATLTKNGKQLHVEIVSGGNDVFTVMDAKPLPNSPNPDGQNANTGIRKLTIHSTKPQGEGRVTVVAVPIINGTYTIPDVEDIEF